MNFGQMWQRNAKGARIELDHIFGNGKLKRGLVDKGDDGDIKGDDREGEKKCL